MSPDLSNLQLVEEQIEVADDAQYVDATEFPPPIPSGIYTLIQGKPTFTATREKFLQAQMDHVVSGGEHDGARVAFDRISNKPFDRQGVRVSMMKDHLRALGDRNTYRTHQDYATAVEAGEGKPFKAAIDWEGGCNHPGTPQECEWSDSNVFRVRGERNFPAAANGTAGHLSETKCTTCGQMVQARTRITRRIAAS